jgi:hypothetical protein
VHDIKTVDRFSKVELENQKLISHRTNSVYDPEFTKALANIPWAEWFQHPQPLRCREDYLSFYHQWITQSKLNRLSGLDRFRSRHLINGTTQAFDELYFRYKERRLRFYRGEYAYHRRILENWAFLEDEPLLANDFLIVSVPFCSTGRVPEQLHLHLDEAERLRVPVMIDCAYFGTCHSLNFDFSHPAIESVAFSLTKGVGLGDIRSGIRYSNFDDRYPICQQNAYDHTILGAAKIGLYMMQEFSSDFVPNKYRNIQETVCEQAGLNPTPCMHLALGDEGWQDYNIDEKFNRIGIRELIKARRKGEI